MEAKCSCDGSCGVDNRNAHNAVNSSSYIYDLDAVRACGFALKINAERGPISFSFLSTTAELFEVTHSKNKRPRSYTNTRKRCM